MQRWRVIGFVAIASAIFLVPSWLWAQGPAKAAPAATVPAAAASTESSQEQLFVPLTEYKWPERVGLILTLLIAVAGLGYAGMLVGQVVGADQGTVKMREVADAVRRGGVGLPHAAGQGAASSGIHHHGNPLLHRPRSSGAVQVGRAAAFFLGAFFSWLVGFVGMSLAVRGNLRVAAAARTSYGDALQLGYRTGTITGMLTDGLGLLGGTIIFIIYGEQAYEVLLGFGFGGTLLAFSCELAAASTPRRLTWRRPGGQGRGQHSRGRPAERRDDRRQRGRQRGRLRRYGSRHLREL